MALFLFWQSATKMVLVPSVKIIYICFKFYIFMYIYIIFYMCISTFYISTFGLLRSHMKAFLNCFFSLETSVVFWTVIQFSNFFRFTFCSPCAKISFPLFNKLLAESTSRSNCILSVVFWWIMIPRMNFSFVLIFLHMPFWFSSVPEGIVHKMVSSSRVTIFTSLGLLLRLRIS